MSLNRALTDMFRVIREEAARNPEFAEKLGDALAAYRPPRRRRRASSSAQSVAEKAVPPPAFDLAAEIESKAFPVPEAELGSQGEAPDVPDINPISFLTKEGEDALRRELTGETYSRDALAALVREHNLDPAGLATKADKSGLVDQIVAQAKKRVARDKALFDY